MADRLTPPVRYPRYGEEPVENNSSRKNRNSRDRNEAREVFRKSKITEFWLLGGFDVPFFALVMLLMAIGLVMLLSASYPTAYFHGENSYSFFIKQAAFAVVGVIAMLFVSKIDYKIFRKYAVPLYIVAFMLLVIVLFYHTTVEYADEDFRRYIPVGPITFQPSEIGKFALVVALSSYFCRFSNMVHNWIYGIVVPLVIIGIYCALVAAENHVSGTILMFALGAVIMFAGGTKSWLFWAGVVAVVAVVLVVFMIPDKLPEYVQKKLIAFTDKTYEPLGSRWQINNSLYAIGSGGLFGVGLGNSKQKYMYVSEPQNDFIFSIVCEELGFIGALTILILFALLVFRGINIAMKARDKFGTYLVMGISAQVGIQTVLNILVITDTIPNTGISLPFFSYGGTSLLMLLFEMGVVLSVSRKANQRKV